MLLLHAPHVVRVRAARRMPCIAELERSPDGALRAAADPDLRLHGWAWLEGRIVERPELALEVALAAPQRAHQADRLVRTSPTARERNTHEVVFVLVPAHPDAEREAAAAQLLHCRDLLRQVHRVVERNEHDRRAQPDALRP